MTREVLNSYRLSTKLTTEGTILNRCSDRRRGIDRPVTATTTTGTVESSRRRTRLVTDLHGWEVDG